VLGYVEEALARVRLRVVVGLRALMALQSTVVLDYVEEAPARVRLRVVVGLRALNDLKRGRAPVSQCLSLSFCNDLKHG
jgi:hypothetical protein